MAASLLRSMCAATADDDAEGDGKLLRYPALATAPRAWTGVPSPPATMCETIGDDKGSGGPEYRTEPSTCCGVGDGDADDGVDDRDRCPRAAGGIDADDVTLSPWNNSIFTKMSENHM